MQTQTVNQLTPNDVRSIIKNLKDNLNQDSRLQADFLSNPHAVLQTAGLSLEARKNLLQDRPDKASDRIYCFCGSYISILTTTLTIEAGR